VTTPATMLETRAIERLSAVVKSIRPVSAEHERTARARAAELAVPAGSLGRLLELSVQLAAIQQTLRPAFPRKAVVVMAGDHGVTRREIGRAHV
jgi:nicotinate-nucleotide--dimethylbenzimidazole phosphoribosyltransferase